MKHLRPVAVLLSGLLLPLPAPALAAAAPAAASVSATVSAAADPDLSYANRSLPAPGLPDWSRVGYLGGQRLPGDGDVSGDPACRITAQQLTSAYGVVPDDGADDTTGLQNAIDHIKSQCSPQANYHRLSLISLPSGRIDVSRQIYVDASFLILRGQGSGAGGTRLVFRPDLNTRYDTVTADGSRWNQDGMEYGSGNDVGKGGWIWPGRGMLRVQTRDVADRYQNEWSSAPANRKDLFEGSVNQHWVSGVKLGPRSDDPGFSARQGHRIVQLIANADMSRFTLGGYVWVGAANSLNFYAQQGVSDRSLMENLHMRQQMFRVVQKDTTAKTIMLDRPLEYDLPVDSTSDGSPPLFGDTPFASKVTPLRIVEGVGFESFAFTQDMSGLPKLSGGTYAPTPAQAVNNYGNMAPEYAMHGIVFKWAANNWARDLNGTMTGSHPVVTEVARNLQIERNSFDGAWNKGKGGNGYLRGSRVWDSLYAYNHSRNLRHFTFQWSASGNVAFRNDLDSDLNLHGGWERYNLFEQNTVTVPYAHRSGNCEANCGGEGGETEEGTWYPIWWGAGPKAAKWSGSSGPQNVFHHNTLIKQTTPGGEFVQYSPYSSGSAGTAFQFGSDNADPRRFAPLSQGGQPIPDWTGRETLDFAGQGVVSFAAGRRPSLFLRDAGQLDPRDANSRRVVTWNMQGAGTRAGGWGDDVSGEYESKYQQGVLQLAAQNDAGIVLLQEAGSPPAGGTHQQDIPQNAFTRADGSQPPVREFRYGGTASRPQGHLYWLHTDTSGHNPPNRVNLAIATRARAENVFVVASAIQGARPALGVTIDGVTYFTVHGFATGGGDMPGLLDAIRTRMATAGPNGTALPWIVMGDFNRDPDNLRNALTGQFIVHAPPAPTHPTQPRQDENGNRIPSRRLDYAVTPTAANAPVVTASAVADRMLLSDHYPVVYEIGDLPDPPEPSGTEQVPAPRETAVLRNASTTNVAGPQGSTHVVGDVALDPANLPAQTWNLAFEPEFPGYYRLVHQLSARYLGQEGSVRDARTVLWPNEAADQLWRPVYQGDGTWTLQNLVTDQLLTAVGGGAALAGRDADGSAAQRWFLQDPGEADHLLEVALHEPSGLRFVVNVEGASTAENTRVILYADTDEPNERFTPVSAGRTGGEDCRYLIYRGKYLNSTASTTVPLIGNGVTLNAFQPDDDGYLWCDTLDPQGGGRSLNNHSFALGTDERMFLTANGENAQLTIAPSFSPQVWALLRVTE
ncbi:hypothetical protein FXF51_20125 [Nonomuraea sp. PA05]|uniref:RICIN domain-containing protein n=1 Tax=Nonomuraea sp. PA05 TaxID=2604466 RepID=UPI0011D548CA|nr:RICIN domain-containing protein [Nonomuraea sp. PA05]TYB64769.1 hypothetical protein FXF51_20125 [Nonomuraea sp. PA05]